MRQLLGRGIYSKYGFVRKSSVALLSGVKRLDSVLADDSERATLPPILANSFPKSGTHLLVQLAEGLPHRMNYGTFVASMVSSFQFREVAVDATCRELRNLLPGEIARGHLYFDLEHEREIARRNIVHYFIYRDPRAVVVSEAHYLRKMNRWHRLAPHFRRLNSLEEAITFSIRGLDNSVAGIDYPNIAERFARYWGWLTSESCMPVRYEDLYSARQQKVLQKMASFYLSRSDAEGSVGELAAWMAWHIQPSKSHTFRAGRQQGWRDEFTAEHHRLFDDVAGELLIHLGYAGCGVEHEPDSVDTNLPAREPDFESRTMTACDRGFNS